MKHLAIATIGTNDIRINTADDPATPGRWHAPSARDDRMALASFLDLSGTPGARAVGSAVLDRLATKTLSLERIRLPMISPFLDHAERLHGPIDKLALIVTNQEPPHHDDTLFFGQIISEALREQGRRNEIDLIVLTSPPNQFDVAYREVGQKLIDLVPTTPDDLSAVSVLASGGTPAIQSAAYQRAINRFGRERCHVYQASRPDVETSGAFSSIHETDPLPVLRDFAAASLRHLIEQGDYPAALAFHQQYLQGGKDELSCWLEAASQRLRQRYGEAKGALPAAPPEERANLHAEWHASLERAARHDREGLLQRVFDGAWAAELALQLGDLTEALWRISFVSEAVARAIAAHLSNEEQLWSCFRKRGAFNPNDRFAIDSSRLNHPHVKSWLENEVHGITISRRNWTALMERLGAKRHSQTALASDVLAALDPLAEARNDALHSGSTASLNDVVDGVRRRAPEELKNRFPRRTAAETLTWLLEELCNAVARATGFGERYRPSPYEALRAPLLPLVTALGSRS
ncbi:MAG: hypothetical protein KatS3mg060_2877 [Dehalococcoidia bacterium]|nr:MAG: hypothetical protein KatS3mg060_2877 [Dehalococcoidia bacterium]